MEIIKTDVAIIGGGASGLMTAVAIAKANKGCRVLVIEHHQRTGRKLMATGNQVHTTLPSGQMSRFKRSKMKVYLLIRLEFLSTKVGGPQNNQSLKSVKF